MNLKSKKLFTFKTGGSTDKTTKVRLKAKLTKKKHSNIFL